MLETKALWKENLELGDQIRLKVPKGKVYVSPKERNGAADQTFSTDELGEFMDFDVVGTIESDGITYIKALGNSNQFFKFFVLQGYLGYLYGIEELDNICRLLQGTKSKSRSIRMEDINELVDYKPSNYEFVFKEGEYTPESYSRGEYEKEGKRSAIIDYHYSKKDIEKSDLLKNMIFKGSGSYIASHSVGIMNDGSGPFFGLGYIDDCFAQLHSELFYSYGKASYMHLAIYPVIYLRYDSSFEDLGVIQITKTPRK